MKLPPNPQMAKVLVKMNKSTPFRAFCLDNYMVEAEKTGA
jgi:hypothetical protein